MNQNSFKLRLLVPSIVIIIAMIVSCFISVGDSQLAYVAYLYLIIRIMYILILNLSLFKYRKFFVVISSLVIVSWLVELAYASIFLFDSHNSFGYKIYIVGTMLGIIGVIASNCLAVIMIERKKIDHKLFFNYFLYITVFSLIITVATSIYYNIYIASVGFRLFQFIEFDIMLFIVSFGYIFVLISAMYRERNVNLLETKIHPIEENEGV